MRSFLHFWHSLTPDTAEGAEQDFRVYAGLTCFFFAMLLLSQHYAKLDGELTFGFLTGLTWFAGYRALRTRDRLEGNL